MHRSSGKNNSSFFGLSDCATFLDTKEQIIYQRRRYVEPQKRKDIISDLLNSNFQYKRLYNEHLDLEARIEKLDKQKYLSLEEERLRKELQKKKLSGRDLMEKLLQEKLTSNG